MAPRYLRWLRSRIQVPKIRFRDLRCRNSSVGKQYRGAVRPDSTGVVKYVYNPGPIPYTVPPSNTCTTNRSDARTFSHHRWPKITRMNSASKPVDLSSFPSCTTAKIAHFFYAYYDGSGTATPTREPFTAC